MMHTYLSHRISISHDPDHWTSTSALNILTFVWLAVVVQLES